LTMFLTGNAESQTLDVMIECIAFLFGICIGSFLNVVIDRFPSGQSIAKGRSYCDFCRKTLRWYELVPVLSWILQSGTCRRCHKKLSPQYPIIEIVTGIGFAFLAHMFSYSPIVLLVALMLFSLFLVVSIIDLKYELISDVHMCCIFVTTMIFHYLTFHSFSGFIPYLVAGLGASLLFLLFWIFSKGKAMGFGDVELAFVLGFLAGFPSIVYGLYIAFLTGAILGVILIVRGNKTLKSHVPFGPFLITGTMIAMLYSGQIQALLKGILW
jgi:prepilin signal peptidase PulO-like enzyme (type II secretory pathway)